MNNRESISIKGKIIDGRGEAGHFMTLEWVQEQCFEIAGFRPYPGTLNIQVEEQDFIAIRKMVSARGIRVIPPGDENAYCEARVLLAGIGDMPAALLYPMVDQYYIDTVEIIAPLKIKPHLGFQSGSLIELSLTIPDPFTHPEGIIFDLDGTLINSVDLFYSMFCQGLQAVELPPAAKEEVLESMGSGAKLHETWQAVTLNMDESLKEQKYSRLLEVFEVIWRKRYENEVKLFPGVKKLLNKLLAAGIPLGVVTSSFYEGKMDLFTREGICPRAVFQSIVTGHDTANSKPHPEPVRLCLKQLGISEGPVIIIGDSPCDIKAGKDAGLLTAGVLTGTGSRKSLALAGADLVLDEAVELPDHIMLERKGSLKQ